jgi:hypothetical protein
MEYRLGRGGLLLPINRHHRHYRYRRDEFLDRHFGERRLFRSAPGAAMAVTMRGHRRLRRAAHDDTEAINGHQYREQQHHSAPHKVILSFEAECLT